VVRAAARAAPLAGPRGMRAVVARLVSETDPITADALGIGLAWDVEIARTVPTRLLVRWVEEGRVLAPLAARALAASEGGEGGGPAGARGRGRRRGLQATPPAAVRERGPDLARPRRAGFGREPRARRRLSARAGIHLRARAHRSTGHRAGAFAEDRAAATLGA